MDRVNPVACPEYERAWAMLTPLAARGFTLTLDLYRGQGPAGTPTTSRPVFCRCIARSSTRLGLRTEYEPYGGPESWPKVVAKIVAVFPEGRAVAT